jgi:hypothetical protein
MRGGSPGWVALFPTESVSRGATPSPGSQKPYTLTDIMFKLAVIFALKQAH